MTRHPEHESTQYRELDDGSEVDLTVTYTITPYDPGRINGPPEDCYPPEGGEVEIVSVTDADGNAIESTDEEAERWQTSIYEHHDFESDDDYQDRD